MPSEEVQFSHYRELVETANPLGVTIRTLDLGGDKVLNLGEREKENNPFMGFRAIRYCLQNPDTFFCNFVQSCEPVLLQGEVDVSHD